MKVPANGADYERELPPGLDVLQTLAGIAILGSAAAMAGLGFGVPSYRYATWIYTAALALSACTLGFLAYVEEGRRQAVGRAKSHARELAAVGMRGPLQLSPADLQNAALDLVLLEDSGADEHAAALREAIAAHTPERTAPRRPVGRGIGPPSDPPSQINGPESGSDDETGMTD